MFGLDKENYQYAFVSGPNTSYLWLLSRTPTVSEEVVTRFIEKYKSLGFDTDKLIFVNHDTEVVFNDTVFNNTKLDKQYTYKRVHF